MDFSETEPLPFGHLHLMSWARGGDLIISVLFNVSVGHTGTGTQTQGLLGPLPFLAALASLVGWCGSFALAQCDGGKQRAV